MNRPAFVLLAIAAAFACGFGLRSSLPASENNAQTIRKVTGIGGLFFKSENPVELKKWYQDNLGLQMDQYGCNFQWYEGADSTQIAYTQWAAFNAKTKYFLPSEKPYMINYRVADMDALVKELRAAGVTFTDTVETYDYGKFVHIMDPEGTKIELWEPVNESYKKYVKVSTK